jgi:hypothetical protein
LHAPIIGDILTGAKDVSWRAGFIEQYLAGERNRSQLAVRPDDLKFHKAPALLCPRALDLITHARLSRGVMIWRNSSRLGV